VEVTDLIFSGLDIFGAISKIIDVASLAKTLDETTDIFSLLGKLGDDAEIIEAAAGVEDALDAATLVTRGKFGEALSKVTDKLVQCAESNMEVSRFRTSCLDLRLTPSAGASHGRIGPRNVCDEFKKAEHHLRNL
jgi:hypothetical protein